MLWDQLWNDTSDGSLVWAPSQAEDEWLGRHRGYSVETRLTGNFYTISMRRRGLDTTVGMSRYHWWLLEQLIERLKIQPPSPECRPLVPADFDDKWDRFLSKKELA